MKSGAPTSAMIAPTGNWRGAAMVRATQIACRQQASRREFAAAGATMR